MRIEVAGFTQRLRAEELIDKGRWLVLMKGIKSRPDYDFRTPSYGFRQVAIRQKPEEILVAHATEFPARVQPGQECEHLFIEERIARLDRRVHGYSVTFCLQQQAGEHDPGAEIQPPVDRVQTAQA